MTDSTFLLPRGCWFVFGCDKPHSSTDFLSLSLPQHTHILTNTHFFPPHFFLFFSLSLSLSLSLALSRSLYLSLSHTHTHTHSPQTVCDLGVRSITPNRQTLSQGAKFSPSQEITGTHTWANLRIHTRSLIYHPLMYKWNVSERVGLKTLSLWKRKCFNGHANSLGR